VAVGAGEPKEGWGTGDTKWQTFPAVWKKKGGEPWGSVSRLRELGKKMLGTPQGAEGLVCSWGNHGLKLGRVLPAERLSKGTGCGGLRCARKRDTWKKIKLLLKTANEGQKLSERGVGYVGGGGIVASRTKRNQKMAAGGAVGGRTIVHFQVSPPESGGSGRGRKP